MDYKSFKQVCLVYTEMYQRIVNLVPKIKRRSLRLLRAGDANLMRWTTPDGIDVTARDRSATYQIALASTGSSTHDACSRAGPASRLLRFARYDSVSACHCEKHDEAISVKVGRRRESFVWFLSLCAAFFCSTRFVSSVTHFMHRRRDEFPVRSLQQ
jgi:hypothetical protein